MPAPEKPAPAPSEQAVELLTDVLLDGLPPDEAGEVGNRLRRLAEAHLVFAARRTPGEALVRVTAGADDGGLAVDVVTDDMPFLVDSVVAELTRQGCAIRWLLHPQVAVRRDGADLVAIEGSAAEGCPAGWAPESWIHVETEPRGTVDAPVDTEGLASRVLAVLGDVRVAVRDWAPMREQALHIAGDLEAAPPAGPAGKDAAEVAELLRWMAEDAFAFLGYAEYRLATEHGDDLLVPVPGTALGLLSPHVPGTHPEGAATRRLVGPVRAKAREPRLLVMTKANSRSTVHRPAYFDYVGIKVVDAAGAVVGERRFVGLLGSTAYSASVRRIPVLRGKVADVLARAGTTPHSHSGRSLLQVLEAYPRDELFATDVDSLYDTVSAVVRLQERRRVRLFVRLDDYGRFVSCLVYLPRDRYDTAARRRIESVLQTAFHGESTEYSARVSESVLARLHVVVRMAPGSPGVPQLPQVDVADVERRLAAAIRTWEDELEEAILDEMPGEEGRRLLGRYAHAFPEAYKEDFDVAYAVRDARRLEGLSAPSARGLVTAISPRRTDGSREFTIYRCEPVSISRVLPLLERLGLEVVDERPYGLERGDGTPAWVYVLGVHGLDAHGLDAHGPALHGVDETGEATEAGEASEAELLRLVQEAFAAVWHGETDSDGFDALVLRAGLPWRQVMVLRAAAHWLRQASAAFGTFSPGYVQDSLVRNASVARLLARLFEARLDPALGAVGDAGRETAVADLDARVLAAVEAVEGLDDDRILRALHAVVRAVLRTNAYQLDTDGGHKRHLSLKLDPHAIPDVVEPRPAYEVFVHAPEVEGVHLRFGAVARGGLRWSDRREDFRTEVLGLVKAQEVKNAVIVPVGAKGGFVVRRPQADPGDREAVLAEGIACYTTFIRGLLDVTDNRVQVGGRSEVVPPPRVVRHDGDDPYLVVAADKGTATFSDLANAIAADYEYWLGDAFASGGSAGYDHKAMGITARGAWKAVERRFREIGLDARTDPFTAVGIGDMSGDVFGNGMLLAPQLRLLAAFDHRHVFLDPDPDPELAFAERARLYALPRSSWADYDPAAISPGGGVFSRRTKHIPVSPEVRAALGLAEDVTELSPPELLQAILRAPVDLFWNGGIGTYVKASTESNADVGDKANDPVRVDGRDLRVRVVGEGGNLGFTQLGRVEAALAGVRIGTDAIDNSAGVDTSDHEVNIKIVVDEAVREGALPAAERGALLVAMTEDVAALVLRDNEEQNALLGVGRLLAPELLPVHVRLIARLEERGVLDRRLERLPSDEQLRARAAHGDPIEQGLTTPEYAVLLAYVKNTLSAEVLAGPVPDEPWTVAVLRAYFPPLLRERLGARLDEHPLRREIVTTELVNDMVNRAGVTFCFRCQEETGAPVEDVVRAYRIVGEVFALDDLWERIDALDGAHAPTVPVEAQDALVLEARRLVDRAARWFLQTRPPGLDVEHDVARYAPAVHELAPDVPAMLRGLAAERVASLTARLAAPAAGATGVPEPLAARVAALLDVFSLLDVVEVARSLEAEPADVAPVYFAVVDRLGIEALIERVATLPRTDRWQAMARASVRDDLYATAASLTGGVLRATEAGSAEQRVVAWEAAHAPLVARTRATVTAALAAEPVDLAALSVALRALRTLVR